VGNPAPEDQSPEARKARGTALFLRWLEIAYFLSIARMPAHNSDAVEPLAAGEQSQSEPAF
jgi:hypothetical protein